MAEKFGPQYVRYASDLLYGKSAESYARILGSTGRNLKTANNAYNRVKNFLEDVKKYKLPMN